MTEKDVSQNNVLRALLEVANERSRAENRPMLTFFIELALMELEDSGKKAAVKRRRHPLRIPQIPRHA